MADETASTIVVGHAYVKHRFSHTDRITSNGSYQSADFRSLRDDQHHRHVSQLPDEHGRDVNFWVFVLRDSIGMLRTLPYENATVPCRYAFDWNG